MDEKVKMRPIADIERDIESNRESLDPLLKDKKRLKEELREAKARQFIEANSITTADVLSSEADGKWHGHITRFIESEAMQNSAMRFAEWNKTIYFRSDLLAGKMPDMPATINDLKLCQKKK